MAISFNEKIGINLAGTNAKPYVERQTRHCPDCLNPQTNIQGLKKIKSEFDKNYVKFVWNFIINENMKIFSKKELMKRLEIEHISDGVLQDKALSVLTMLGYLRKEKIEFLDIKGKTKICFKYIKNYSQVYPLCYDENKDCHVKIDWFGDAIIGSCYLK